MSEFIEKNRKTIFYIIVICTYVCALAFNCLTPYLSDDYAYLMELRDNGASGLGDVCRLAYAEYFQHGGRLLHYFTFRLFLFIPSKLVFDFVASLYFVALGVLIYLNVEKKKKFDLGILILSFGLEWLLAIYPGQTMFWITGAVVYLFAFVYVLGSITLYRYLINRSSLKRPWLMAVVMFVLALLAGNSSENNSAAAILIFFIVTVAKYVSERKGKVAALEGGAAGGAVAGGKFATGNKPLKLKSFVKPFMVTTLVGYLVGYLLLILSPGTWGRAAATSEGDYTGFVGLLSHIYKIMMALKELFLPILIVIGILITVLVVFKKFDSFGALINNTGILYLIAAICGSFVLAVISPPMNRAYFGASIFLIISAISLMMDVRSIGELKTLGNVVKYSAVVTVCIIFTFTYLENLVNLARIYRETNEQTAIMEQAVEEGHTDYVEIPQLHADFDNKYTIAYFPQIDPDPGFWINTFYEGWYGIKSISAVPREIWDAEE